MDTNKKIKDKNLLISKFKKSLNQLDQTILWKRLEKEKLSLLDWENITDHDSLSVKIRYSVYLLMQKKALRDLKNKDLVMLMIKLTSIVDPEYYEKDDDFTPYYAEILNYKLSIDEIITVFLHTSYSFDLFIQTEEREIKYEEIQKKLCDLILKNNPCFQQLNKINELGLFYLFTNIEERLLKYGLALEKAIYYDKLGMLETKIPLSEDNLIESISECATEPAFDLYLKFKELAEDEDGMDNALDDAKSILNL